MKKLFTFLLGIALSGLCSAQLVNGSFENWSSSTIEVLDNWDCSSALNFVSAELRNPLLKTTDKYDGQYALKMIAMAGATKNFVGINNGYWDGSKFTKGFPYTKQVDTLIGWYKYTPKQTGGTGKINIEFKKASVSFGNTTVDIVANSGWAMFQIPFDLSQAPDSAVIMMNTINTPLNLADTGSVLIIDALQFKSTPQGIQPVSSAADAMIGPNPTTGEFNLFYEVKNAGKATYTLCDASGKVIRTELLHGANTTINLSGQPKGLYIIRVVDGSVFFTKKLNLQ